MIVLALLGGTVVMFALGRPRMDVVAIIMMTALPLTGLISMTDALAGFSDPNVILIAALFVIGEALVRTGVAQRIGDRLTRHAGQNESRLIALLMVVVAIIGSVMSSTGVVAIFIPTALRIARQASIAPGRLLMPMTVAALISGMMTLIGTPPNLIVHGQLIRAGYPGFHFFSFTLFGLPVLVTSIGYMLIARRWLARRTDEEDRESKRPRLSRWIDEYDLSKREYRLQVTETSPWIGRPLKELDLRSTLGINILTLQRHQRFSSSIIEPTADTELRRDDVIFVDVRDPNTPIDRLCRQFGLVQLPLNHHQTVEDVQNVGMAEVMVPATSRLIGKTAITARFRSMYKLSVIGIKRGNTPIRADIQNEVFQLGDTLLVAGPWRAIRRLRTDPHELIVLQVPADLDDVIALPSRAPLALVTLGIVVFLMVFGIVPNVQAALIGCLLLGLFRCIDVNTAYRAIQWPTLLLIIGMLPFSQALQNTGGTDAIAAWMLNLFGAASPTVVLIILFGVTVLLGLFISNTATAIFMAPVAIALAAGLELSPYPFAMTVALASSAAFITPVSSPVNALVVGPGNYRFIDFVRVGLPLAFIVMGVSIVMIRIALPF